MGKILDTFRKVFDTEKVNEDIQNTRQEKAINRIENPPPRGGERHPVRIIEGWRSENRALAHRLEDIRHAIIREQRDKLTASMPKRQHRWERESRQILDKYQKVKQEQGQKWNRRLGALEQSPAIGAGRRISGMISALAYKSERIYPKGGQASYTRTKLRGQGRATPRMIRAVNLAAGSQIPIPKSTIRGKGGGYQYQDEYGQVTKGRGGGRPGRPRGTYDMRYAQFGGIYGYRKWIAQKRALERLQARGQGVPQQMPSQAPQMSYDEQSQMEQQMPAQPIQQQPQPIPQQPTGIKLWDPNFMKLSTGQGNQGIPVKKVDALNPELPQGDKYGDYYTEPDFFSGKQVLRRRSGDRLFKW